MTYLQVQQLQLEIAQVRAALSQQLGGGQLELHFPVRACSLKDSSARRQDQHSHHDDQSGVRCCERIGVVMS